MQKRNQEKAEISPKLDLEKQELRKQAKTIRKNLSAEEQKKAGETISEHLHQWLCESGISHVYAYYPLGNEADILPLCETVLNTGIHLAFPKVYGDDMVFYEVCDLRDDFNEGSFHIMEPCSGMAVDWKDACVLVPGLGFDLNGNRLGYGKGYYDRYFSKHDYKKLIGIAYEQSVFDSLPSQGRDLKMDCLCTDICMRIFDSNTADCIEDKDF